MSDVVWWVWLLTGLVVGANFGALAMGVLAGGRRGQGRHRPSEQHYVSPKAWYEQ